MPTRSASARSSDRKFRQRLAFGYDDGRELDHIEADLLRLRDDIELRISPERTRRLKL